jgi:ATP-dependent RNA helicase DeaD
METYRIEVGRQHGVKPGNIVGAIANEAGLTSSHIGRIEIFADHCFIDMLVGMSPETFAMLKQVVVAGRPLNISRAGAAPAKRPFTKKPSPTPSPRHEKPAFATKKFKSKKGKRFIAKS